MAALPKMLRDERERGGLSVERAAWRLGISPREYRELEAGTRTPTFEIWDRICKVFRWPQSFVS